MGYRSSPTRARNAPKGWWRVAKECVGIETGVALMEGQLPMPMETQGVSVLLKLSSWRG
jgi:hypothetical protein